MLRLYNTLTRTKQIFKPLAPPSVGLYTCGPTVYNYVHTGNLRTYIFEDILKRVLLYNNYTVKHVMNITDVGHLTDDADSGEDKMEKGAAREGKTAWDIAAFYTDAFQKNIAELNILPPTVWCRATDHIPEQIAQVQMLADKGFAYETEDGIYFDTTMLSDYGKLAHLEKQHLKAGARVDIGEKKNPHDFALWKFTPNGEKRQMEWDAFGRKGFPGWHIECSAMSMKYLGPQFDIHCGGVDHIPVHHSNELAQAEAITDKKPWVKYWLHGEFLLLSDKKMAKSGDNFLTLDSLKKKGISPIAYRYWLLQTHYRKQLTFSWKALAAAEAGLNHLYATIAGWGSPAIGCAEFEERFTTALNDDLNLPTALAIMWELVKSDYPAHAKAQSLRRFDTVLGLRLTEAMMTPLVIPVAIQKLLDERMTARQEKNWAKSDRLREKIEAAGFVVEDTASEQRLKPKIPSRT